MANITLNAGTGGSTLATEQNASAPNENYQIIEVASGAGGAFANRLTVTAAGAAKIDASGTTIQANAGTNLNTSALALESGNLASLLARLPAVAALADATANPSLSALQSYLMGYNGTTWDRLKSSTANGLQVDVTRIQGSVAVTGTFWQATQPVSGTVSVSNFPASQAVTGTFWQATQPVSAASLPLPSGAATSAKQPALGTAGTASADVLTVQGIASMTALKVDGSAVTQPVSGTFWQATQPVSLASTTITGTVAVTESGTWTVQPGNTANTTPWLSTNVPPTSGSQGWSFNYQSALAATKVQIKATAGTFGGYIMLTNPNTAETYLQVFNKASASVTVGTTAPDFVLRIPGLATASGTGVAANLELVNGVAMSTGITVAATTTATGSTAPANALTATFLFA